MEQLYNENQDVFVEEMILGQTEQEDCFQQNLIDQTRGVELEKIKIPVMEPSKVYVKRDENGAVVEVASEYFIEDYEGWQYLTEGFGDKFSHPKIKDFM